MCVCVYVWNTLSCCVSVKFRVMCTCWLCLIRAFCSVDAHLCVCNKPGVLLWLKP